MPLFPNGNLKKIWDLDEWQELDFPFGGTRDKGQDGAVLGFAVLFEDAPFPKGHPQIEKILNTESVYIAFGVFEI